MTITLKPASRARLGPLASSLDVALASVLAVIRTLRNRQAARRLSDLPDYLLTDLGLRRDDVHEALSADWREDPTYRLAMTASRRRRGL